MSKSYLPLLLNALQDAVYVLDEDRAVLFANPAALAMFGGDPIGMDFVKISRHPDCIGAIGEILSGAKTTKQVVTEDALSGASYRVIVADLGHDNEDGARVVVSMTDVSDLREAEQMRSDFVANVSHELRSPLTAVSGFIETLQDESAVDPQQRQHFLSVMEMEAQRMVRLIADLLSLSKVESQQRMRPEGEADIGAIISRITTTLADSAAREGKQFELKLTTDMPPVPGSEDELTQVLQNLIENAIKYGRSDTTVTIETRLMDTVPGINGPALVIDVKDEGEGIAQRHIPRLTERFYRVDTHRSRNKGGTGLGLAIVKHIVHRHRGRLQISSKQDAGSCFSVSLPTTRPGR